MSKRQKKDSVVETAVLEALESKQASRRTTLTRFICGHVGAEIGVKAKAWVRFAEVRNHPVEDVPTKCAECK